MRRTTSILSAAAATVLAAVVIGQSPLPSARPDRLIGGTVLVDPPGDEKAVAIAGFTISLHAGDAVAAQATTNEYGSYKFVNVAPGSYRLCWGGAAWKPNCREEEVVVADRSVYVSPTRVDPNGRFVFGQVVGAEAAGVEARSAGGSVGTAVANVFGQYVLAGLPDEEVAITATAAGATATRSVMPSAAGASMDLLLVPQQPAAAPPAPAAPVCPKLSFFFDCPTGTPGGCDNKDLALARLNNNEEEAKDYYRSVDRDNTRLTLAQWFAVAGFNSRGGRGTRGFYTNSNDLGFGRDMHILETKFGVFAYVTNFAEDCTLQHPGNARLAHSAPREQAIATVAMEWSNPTYNGKKNPGADNDPANRFVKFFVFGGDGKRQLAADLDGNGARFIPSLCINCHGGQGYSGAPNVNASFLPFDLDGLKFDGKPRYRDFQKLNQLVRNSRPSSAIIDLIDHWYPPGGDDVPDPYRPPPGMSGRTARRCTTRWSPEAAGLATSRSGPS